MLSATILLLCNSICFMLRLSGGAKTFPRPLSKADESKYLSRVQQGDVEARNKLVEHNLRLVAHVMKKYYTQTQDQEDLISIGTIGLIKAIATFNPDKGARLATYAARCIENEILMHFRAQRRMAGEVSLSEPIDTDKDGNTLTLIDVMCVEDDMLELLNSSEMETRLFGYMQARLTGREASIIAMRYGLNNRRPKTQKEIAAQCGISRSYVSRIESRALKKLEAAFREEEVTDAQSPPQLGDA